MNDEQAVEQMRIPAWVFALSALLALGCYPLIRATDGDFAVYFIAALLGLPIYLLPSYVARPRENFVAICVLNILLGWTFVGWVIALVWALKKD